MFDIDITKLLELAPLWIVTIIILGILIYYLMKAFKNQHYVGLISFLAVGITGSILIKALFEEPLTNCMGLFYFTIAVALIDAIGVVYYEYKIKPKIEK